MLTKYHLLCKHTTNNNHWLRNPSHPQSYRWYGIPAGRLYPRLTGPRRLGFTRKHGKFKATKKIIKISDYLVPNGVISRAKASYLKITAPPQAKYSVAYKASTAFLKATDTPRPIGRGFLDRSKNVSVSQFVARRTAWLSHKSSRSENLYGDEPTGAPSSKFSRSHTNSADLTSRLPDGRSIRDRRRLAKHLQALKRNAPRVPVLYPRPIGRDFTTNW